MALDFKKASTLLREYPWYLLMVPALLTCLFLGLWQHGPVIQPDTGSYLTPNPLRPALCPIFTFQAWHVRHHG